LLLILSPVATTGSTIGNSNLSSSIDSALSSLISPPAADSTTPSTMLAAPPPALPPPPDLPPFFSVSAGGELGGNKIIERGHDEDGNYFF